MKDELRWRVIYGYGPTDYISIDETAIEKAKYAMVTGKIFNHAEKMIQGSEIKRIEEDIFFYTGWSETYKPSGSEDMAQIQRDVPYKLLRERGKLADNRVRHVVATNQPNLLETPDKILLE